MREYIKKISGSGHNTALIISNDEMEDILKIVISLEDSGIIVEGAIDMIKNDGRQQSGGFLSMLLGTLGASLSSNMLTGKGVIRGGERMLEQAMDLKDLHLKKFFGSTPPINKRIIKMSLGLMVSLVKVICLVK